MDTNDFWDTYDDESIADKLQSFMEKLADIWAFIKKHHKGILIIASIVIVCLVIVSVYSANISNQVNQYLNGKMLIYHKYSDSFEVYAFKDGMVAEETWYGDSYKVYGDIEAFDAKYKASPVLFTDRIQILKKPGDASSWKKMIDVYLTESGEVQVYTEDKGRHEWRETDAQEVFELRRKYTCEHAFGEYVTTQAATCSTSGKAVSTCSKCGYIDEKSTEKLEHNYKNKTCTECGAEKQAEKSDLEPNTWYVYQDVLLVQNCLITHAYSVGQGKGMNVQYYAVCQHCHAIAELPKLAGPEVGYPVEKIYTCEYCFGKTMIRFKIG